VQRAMRRLDSFLTRRRWLVLGAWALILLAALPFAARQSENLTGGGFDAPGSQSKAVTEAVERDFPNTERASLAVLLVPREGAGAGQLRTAVGRVQRAADKTKDVSLLPPVAQAAGARAEQGKPVLVPLRVEVGEDTAADIARDLRDELGIDDGARGGVQSHLIGQGGLWAGLQVVSKEDLAQAESVGFPIVLLILLAVFGSFAAATLPLALGVVSVIVTGAVIYFLSRSMNMSVFVTNMASMIGIGVAVDYSLFIVARYRQEIAGGKRPEEARATALSTSGVAVAFSGLTVIVSLAGLWMVHNTALRSMALGAMLVVAFSVIASATLLPVLIQLYGRRGYARNRVFTITGLIFRSRSRRRRGSTRTGEANWGFWRRWTELVTRRPVAVVILSSAILLTLAIPVLSLKTGTGALRQFPEGNETRVGFEKAAAIAGPGASATVSVLVEFRRGSGSAPENAAAVRAVERRMARDPQVVRLRPTQASKGGRAALVSATPRADSEAPATRELVRRVRRDLAHSGAARAAHLSVGGSTARQLDVQDLVSGSMWKILLFVLGVSYVVLLILLRSVLLPLKAVVMNLLSVGAAYGVLVAVFQWGWLGGFLGLEKVGYLDWLTPPLVLAVVFGLSMDYEVFLLSRIRERWEATGDSRQAVAEGLAASAKTITSAAVIMAAVFAVFIFTGVPSIKQIGLGNAVAIILDATLVRLVLVPAAMELLGDWNWWLPKPLARILPRSSFEQAPEPTAAR
jgi:uncharacterized membrane protein YdfJ with MMPL/SSD domain